MRSLQWDGDMGTFAGFQSPAARLALWDTERAKKEKKKRGMAPRFQMA
ncbi:hypothetical protein [Cupriavidus pauculus]|nr:hypothetical protein [Cupriavidus pauculus]GJG95944.1 hypothetical protein CBA19C6_15665 [Cupriavidus pauculus]